MQEELSENYGL